MSNPDSAFHEAEKKMKVWMCFVCSLFRSNILCRLIFVDSQGLFVGAGKKEEAADLFGRAGNGFRMAKRCMLHGEALEYALVLELKLLSCLLRVVC